MKKNLLMDIQKKENLLDDEEGLDDEDLLLDDEELLDMDNFDDNEK